MNVLLDLHHHDLFRSLYLLFRKRLGYNVYLPVGMDWNYEVKYANYSDVNITKQFLVNSPEWLNVDKDVPDVQFLTFEEFKDIPIDIMVCSLIENVDAFDKANRDYNKKAKQVIQVGNNFQSILIDDRCKNLLSSSMVVYQESSIAHKIFYHQEIDLFYFHPEKHCNPESVYSLQHFFGSKNYAFKSEYDLYSRISATLPSWDFRCYGSDCPHGPLRCILEEFSQTVRECGFIYHVKPQGDGFGHIYHNASACGKPVIFKSEYLYYNDIPMTPLMLFNEETSIDLSKLSVESASRKLREMAACYPEVSQIVAKKFKSVVDYDSEFQHIKTFMQNLI